MQLIVEDIETTIEAWRSGAENVDSPAGPRFVMGIPHGLQAAIDEEHPPPPTVVTCAGDVCQVTKPTKVNAANACA